MKSIILTVRKLISENIECPTFMLVPGLSLKEALKAKLGTISQAAQNKLEEDSAKKEAKAEAKADAARKKKLVRSPIVFRVLFN